MYPVWIFHVLLMFFNKNVHTSVDFQKELLYDFESVLNFVIHLETRRICFPFCANKKITILKKT
jgi:hypothetical protein